MDNKCITPAKAKWSQEIHEKYLIWKYWKIENNIRKRREHMREPTPIQEEILKANYGETHNLIGVSYNNVAQQYGQKGDFDKQLESFISFGDLFFKFLISQTLLPTFVTQAQYLVLALLHLFINFFQLRPKTLYLNFLASLLFPEKYNTLFVSI